MGVFYQEGFGVSRNLEKSIELLKKASKMGNA
jgi:TPR repeat protein